MAWAKLDDNFFDHPKVVRAGGDATLLYLAGLCYANRHLTDGCIPGAAIPRLTDRKQPARLAVRLVEVGLWEAAGEDFIVHDYHAFNDAAGEVVRKREQKAVAGQIGGRRSGEARRQATGKQSGSRDEAGGTAGDEANGKQSGSNSEARHEANASPFPPPTPPPIPHSDADADADKKKQEPPPAARAHVGSPFGFNELQPIWNASLPGGVAFTADGFFAGEQLAGKVRETAVARGEPPSEFAARLLVAWADMATDWGRRNKSPKGLSPGKLSAYFAAAVEWLDGGGREVPQRNASRNRGPVEPPAVVVKGDQLP